MLVLRSAVFWAFVVAWSIFVLGLAGLASFLTLGLLRHRLITFFGPLFGKPCLWVGGIRLSVSGREHLAEAAGRIMVFNHGSFLEVMIFPALGIRRWTFLAKRSFAFIPVMGQAMWFLGGHFVDRGNRKKAVSSVQRLGADLRKYGLTALIAPEGTRSRTGELHPFKMGAFHVALDTRAPVVPAVVHGVHRLLKPDDWKAYPGTVYVDDHPSIDTSGWTRETLRKHADALHADYARWMDEGPVGR